MKDNFINAVCQSEDWPRGLTEFSTDLQDRIASRLTSPEKLNNVYASFKEHCLHHS